MTDKPTLHTHRPKIPPRRYEISILHLALSALCYGVAVGGLIYALIALSAMPDTVGYHFSASGTFDLFGDKSIAFLHPLIAEYLLLAVFTLFSAIAVRVKPLKHLSHAANRCIAFLTVCVCDLFSLATVAIFGHWIYCVAGQTPLNTNVMAAILWILAAALMLFIAGLLVAIIGIRIHLFRTKRSK